MTTPTGSDRRYVLRGRRLCTYVGPTLHSTWMCSETDVAVMRAVGAIMVYEAPEIDWSRMDDRAYAEEAWRMKEVAYPIEIDEDPNGV